VYFVYICLSMHLFNFIQRLHQVCLQRLPRHRVLENVLTCQMTFGSGWLLTAWSLLERQFIKLAAVCIVRYLLLYRNCCALASVSKRHQEDCRPH